MSSKPRTTVCLAMILKNESAIIERCLDSAKPFIDGYFIIDTGSEDNTIELVQKSLDGIPGEVKSEEWINYGENRTSLVQQARLQGYDYLLLGDADMVFEGPKGCLDNLTADSYLIKLPGGFEYWMPYLVSSKPDWRYFGVTHEFLGTNSGTFTQERHPSFLIHHKADGGNRSTKFEQDRLLLEAEYEKRPDDDRNLFYLAQTCKDLGDLKRSRELYTRRVEIGGWDEEVYWSLLQIGEITRSIEDYLRAWCYRPSRPEATQRLMKTYNEHGLYRAAYVLYLNWKMSPNVPTTDILFVERWAEDWGIPFEAAIAAWWIGEQEEAIKGFKDILARDDVWPEYVEACKNNLLNCGVED